MDRRKELKSQYKDLKPDMGLYLIRCEETKKYHLETTKNLKGHMNGAAFKLETGNHPVRELQKEWKALGKDKFSVGIAEHLEYKEDAEDSYYDQELLLMKMLWEEKLKEEGMTAYSK